MSVDVKGKNCKLWKKERDGRNGDKWITYSIGVAKKDMSGNWVNAYQDVYFTKNADPTGIPNGTTFDFEGWMSAKTRRDRDGKEINVPVIVINKAVFEYNPNVNQADSFEQLDVDVPF